MEQVVIDAMKRIPQLQSYSPDTVECERLGGRSNFVYRIGIDDADYLLRVPSKGSEIYIDRQVEEFNTRAAIAAGFSPDLLYFAEDGLMLSEYLLDFEQITPEKVLADEKLLKQISKLLRRFHTSGPIFQYRFDAFATINKFLEILPESCNEDIPEGYHQAIEELKPIKKLLADTTIEILPCHCDVISENFVKALGKLWIVDWEFSGRCDPLWDLATLALSTEMSKEMEIYMLTNYYGHHPTDTAYSRMFIMKAIVDLVWALWGVAKKLETYPGIDSKAYAKRRFTRAYGLMCSDEYTHHVNLVASNV